MFIHRFKRGLVIAAGVLTVMLVLSGCGKSTGGATIVEGKVNVITSFYPIYEFAKAIGGEEANVINLLPTGVEPHDWTRAARIF
ncbi:hypothetical protein HMSSN139_04710 [Paenibacillus sp. HMSSN-139]|nr:hypothetical protein HMSSN139_04710 [Paenibacillus sp. HMSSN-139]